MSEHIEVPRGRAGFLRMVANLPETVLVLLVAALLVDMLAGTIWRYAVGKAIYWAEEVGVIGLVWMTMIGSAVAIKRNAHFTMPTFLRLSPRAQLVLASFTQMLVLLIGVLMIITGAEITRSSLTMLTPALEMNMAIIDSASIVGGALIAVYAGYNLVEMITTGVSKISESH